MRQAWLLDKVHCCNRSLNLLRRLLRASLCLLFLEVGAVASTCCSHIWLTTPCRMKVGVGMLKVVLKKSWRWTGEGRIVAKETSSPFHPNSERTFVLRLTCRKSVTAPWSGDSWQCCLVYSRKVTKKPNEAQHRVLKQVMAVEEKRQVGRENDCPQSHVVRVWMDAMPTLGEVNALSQLADKARKLRGIAPSRSTSRSFRIFGILNSRRSATGQTAGALFGIYPMREGTRRCDSVEAELLRACFECMVQLTQRKKKPKSRA